MNETYPSKRAYARNPLRKFLKLAGIYDKFKDNCDDRGHKEIGLAFIWGDSTEGYHFWDNVDRNYAEYKLNGTVPPRWDNDK